MATVQDLLAVKGTNVLSIGPTLTVLDAAVVMNEHKVGCVVVLEGGQLAGVLTERDILQRVVAQRRDPAATRVAEVMTTEVFVSQPHTSVEEARGVMKNRRIRHLPVLDESRRLCGLVSIGDLNAFENSSQEMTIHVLQEYLYGRA